METEKIKKLFDDFQKNYAKYKILPCIVQSVYLNIFSAQIARAAGIDIPLLELSRNSKVWCDRFSDFNNTWIYFIPDFCNRLSGTVWCVS